MPCLTFHKVVSLQCQNEAEDDMADPRLLTWACACGCGSQCSSISEKGPGREWGSEPGRSASIPSICHCKNRSVMGLGCSSRGVSNRVDEVGRCRWRQFAFQGDDDDRLMGDVMHLGYTNVKEKKE